MISVIVQEEGGVECLRAVEEIPAGVEITISYRSMITMRLTIITMRLTMKMTMKLTITMSGTVMMVVIL